MSFGFAIGDFIAVLDKARLIYKKCKSAPEDYAVLSHHVAVLSTVLNDTTSFVERDVPPSKLKLDALLSAGEGCRSTLNEAENFLDKYLDVSRKKNWRYIQVAKFITRDVEGLKTKLINNTSLLQLSLTSLTSLSLAHVQSSLDLILREYRNGSRQGSILSSAILDNEPAEPGKLYEQITLDLEDDDIHPEAIELNQSYIEEWLKASLATSELEEEPYQALQDLPAHSNHNMPMNEHMANPEMFASRSQLDQTLKTYIGDTTRHSRRPLQPSKFDGVCQSVSKTNIRELSTPPVPLAICDLLMPLLEARSDTQLDSTAYSHRISQAFQEQDWKHQGLLLRSEVLEVVEEFVKVSEADLDAICKDTGLRDFVFSFDNNKDGQFDKNEYTALMENIITKITVAAYEKFNASMIQPAVYTLEGLPWTLKDQTSTALLPDLELYTKGVLIPEEGLSECSFTSMALKADSKVVAISKFERQWLTHMSSAFRARITDSFNVVRKAALAFTLFEHPLSARFISDLDVAMLCGGIIRNPSVTTSRFEDACVSTRNLVGFLRTSLDVLDILSTSVTFMSASTRRQSSKKMLYSEPRRFWETRNFRFCAQRLATALKAWGDVVPPAIMAFRQASSLPDLVQQVTSIVETYRK